MSEWCTSLTRKITENYLLLQVAVWVNWVSKTSNRLQASEEGQNLETPDQSALDIRVLKGLFEMRLFQEWLSDIVDERSTRCPTGH